MKKIIVTSLLVFSVILTWGQGSLNTYTRHIGNDYKINVIPASLNNLITLVNCTSNGFKSLMNSQGYYINQESSGKNLVYDNNCLTAYMHNNNGVGITTIIYDSYNSAVWINGLQKQMYPYSAIPDLYEELKPYYTKTENGNDYFLISKESVHYGIIIKVQEGAFYTRIAKLVD